MDQDLTSRATETIALGREGHSAWWQGVPRRSASGLFAVLAVIALGLGTISLLSEDTIPQADRGPATHAVPRPHSSDFVATLRLRHMRGAKEINYAGVILTVPQYWGRDRVTKCGALLSDTVIFPGGGQLACNLAWGCCPTSKMQHSSVEFVPVQFREPGDLRRRSGLPSSGAIQWGPVHPSDGGYVQFIDVSLRGLRVVVRSPHEALVERLSASVQLTT